MRALLLLGRFDECARVDVGPFLPLRAMCLHSLGWVAEARASIDALAERLDRPDAGLTLNAGGVAGDIAGYFAWTGDFSATLSWLHRSIAMFPSAQFLVHHTGAYDRVRSEPRFEPGLAAIRAEVRRRVAAMPPAFEG